MLDTFKLFQLGLSLLFLILIIFPIKMPLIIASFLNSLIGIMVAIIIVFLLFIYTNPILGILFIILFYILFQRSTIKISRVHQTQENTNFELKKMNENNFTDINSTSTLEEQMINIMAPIIPKDKSTSYIYTQFKPINDNIGTASIL